MPDTDPIAPTDPTDLPSPVTAAPTRRHRASFVIVGWFVLVTVLPALLHLTGVRAHAAENRATATMPKLSARSLTKDSTYRKITAAFEDHLPGRDQAVDATRSLDLDVLDDSPNPRVVRGDDDTLFLTDTWELVCDDPHSAADLALRMGQIAEELKERGPDVRVYLVPDKVFMLGEKLGDHPGRTCSDERRRQLRAADRDHLVIDPYPPFEAAEAAGEQTFWKADSHANYVGEEIIQHDLIESLQPGLWDQVPRATQPETPERMDLWFLLGEDRAESGQARLVARTDVTTETRAWNAGDEPPETWAPLAGSVMPSVPSLVAEFRTTGDGPLIEGDTLIIGDSQMQRLAAKLAPYFRHLTVRLYPGLGFEMPDVDKDIDGLDHLVIESVERGAYERFFNATLPKRLGVG